MNGTPANLRQLIDAYCDGSATEAQLTQLADLLRDDPDARRAFAKAMDLHAALRWRESGAPQPVAEPTPSPKSAIGNRQSKIAPRPIPFIIYPVAIAAALLLTAAIVGLYLFAFSTDPQPAPIQPNRPGPAVATLIENTGDLRTPHGYPAEGDDYSAGEYSLGRGTAEFMLTNAVNVKLRGETRLFLRNNMNARLDFGSAVFTCPPGAEGYTVRLPGGERVVDLGTAFALRSDDSGEAWLSVIDGRVELQIAGQPSEPLGREQSMWRDTSGTWHRAATPPRTDQLVLWVNAESNTARTDDASRAIEFEPSPWSFAAASTDPALTRLRPGKGPLLHAVATEPSVLRFDAGAGPLVTPELSLAENQTIAIVFADRARDVAQRQLINLNGPPHVVFETLGQPRRIRARLWDGANRTPSIESKPLRPGLNIAVFRADAETDRMQLWINGVLAGEQELPFSIAQSSRKAIGGHPGNAPANFRGDIAEVLIYNDALSDSDIDSLHKTLTQRYAISSAEPQETNENPVPAKETSP